MVLTLFYFIIPEIIITFNVLLSLKVQEVFFSRAKHGSFQEIYPGGPRLFLLLNCPQHNKEQFCGQKSLSPL
jgi:hypothetical protein